MTLFSHDDDLDDPKIFIQKKPFSTTAQAILDAYRLEWQDEQLRQDVKCLAAAIRALVEQMLPEESTDALGFVDVVQRLERQRLRREFLAVADELEGVE